MENHGDTRWSRWHDKICAACLGRIRQHACFDAECRRRDMHLSMDSVVIEEPRHHYKWKRLSASLRHHLEWDKSSTESEGYPNGFQMDSKWIQSVTLWMHLAQRERSALQPCCFATCASLQRLSASRLATSSTVQQPFKSSKPSMHDLRLSIGKSWMWFIQLLDLQVFQFEFL